MKKFLELLATEFSIAVQIKIKVDTPQPVTVIVNGQVLYNQRAAKDLDLQTSVSLTQGIEVSVKNLSATVISLTFDGWETRPQYGEQQNGQWQFATNNLPFYIWKHHATGQGWLLMPHI